MNTYLFASVENTWLLAGWTMIHFLWLGTLVALAGLLSRWLLRRAAANVRYAVAITCLATLAVLPIAIATWLHQYSPSIEAVVRPLQSDATDQVTRTEQGGTIELKNIEPAIPTTSPAIEKSATPISAQPAPRTAQSTDLTITAPLPATAAPMTADPLALAVAAFDASVRYLPWLWLIGTPLTFALTATGLLGARRLRHASRPITDGPIAEALEKLAASLRLSRRVVVAVCDRIAAPVLIGILRPIILLPPAALTGYSPDEIEMVLLHELAHVRRSDNLVNLMQRLVESLLFFHPAVWLISSWVRRERESCCDALVVTRTDSPHAYAELLVALAAQMPRSVLFHPAASSAMAAGPLRSRIRRILQLDDDPMLISGKSFTLVLGTLLVAATLAVLYVPSIGQAEQSTTAATDGAKAKTDAAAEAQTKDNLNNLSLAIQNYHTTRKFFPAHAIYDASGKPLLSWRVQILPFLDEPKLYQEFHLNEPWDSEHNRKLIARMPAVFKNPKLNKPGLTNYLAVVGQECVFNGTPKALGIEYVTDGTAKTIALVEANADLAVEWTKPQDWNFNRALPTEGLGQLWPGGWYAAWVDGSVRRIKNSEPADRISIQFTRAGGESKSLEESANRTATEFAGVEGAPGDLIDAALAGGPEAAPGEATEFSQAAVIEGHALPKTGSVDAETELLLREIADIQKKKHEIESQLYQAQADYLVIKDQLDDPKLTQLQKPNPKTEQLIKGYKIRTATLQQQLATLQRSLDEHSKTLKERNSKSAEVESRESVTKRDKAPNSKFPTLEEQKLADLAWKRLQLEFEPLNEKDLKRIQALGYEGGLKIVGGQGQMMERDKPIIWDDILVGLHAWPVTNFANLAEVLNRNDLDELNPLKYYIVRHLDRENPPRDAVVTGRIGVTLQEDRSRNSYRSRQSSSPSSSNPKTSKTSTPTAPSGDAAEAAVDATSATSSQPAPNPTPPKRDSKTNAPIITGIVPNPNLVKLSDGQIGSITFDPNSPAPAGGNSQAKQTPAEAVFVAYDIPLDLKSEVQRYFRKTGARSMDDERGHNYIVQANSAWHDNFSALLKATPKWRDPVAAKDRAAAPIVRKKVGNEDILEWRSVGLTFKPIGKPRSLGPTSEAYLAVSEVAPGSPAAWADIRPGDVLTDIGNFNARTMPEVQSLLKALGEGLQSKKEVRVMFVRETSSRRSTVVADFTIGPDDLRAKPVDAQNSKSAASAAGQSAARSEKLKVYFFYTPDSKPSSETRPLVKTVVDAFPGVGLVEVDASQASDQVRKFNIDKVPTCVLTRYGQEVSRVVGAQTQLELATAIQSALSAPVSEPIKVAEEGVIPVLSRDPKTGLFVSTNPSSQGRGDAKGEKSTLRYEGKSFEGWKSAWQSELSLEKRTEAVRALAAFGSRGYGPEASEAILSVAQEYEMLEHGNTPEGKFGDAVTGSLTVRIPKKDWLPLLRKRYEADPAKWQNLAIQLLTQSTSSNEKENEDIRSMLLMLAQSTNSYVSSQAFDALVRRYPDNEELKKLLVKLLQDKSHWISAVRWLGWTNHYPPEAIELILHGDHKQQADARRTFQDNRNTPARKALLVTMIDILKDDSKSADHITAIRTLAGLGAASSGTFDNTEAPQLLKEIVKKGPLEKQVAAAFALQCSTRGQTQATGLLAEYARDAEGKGLDRLAAQTLILKESDAFNGK